MDTKSLAIRTAEKCCHLDLAPVTEFGRKEAIKIEKYYA